MKRPLVACIALIILLTTAVAQRPRNTSRPTPTPVPTPVQAQLPTNAPPRQRDLTDQVEDLSQQIERGMTSNQKRTIAVVEFVDLNGKVSNFGRFLAEELITHLYQTGKFKVIERQLLNRIITEQKLSLTGAVDPSTAQKLGRILGVEAIVTGTITDLSRNFRVNSRLLSTETGEVFAVASTTITKDESVMGLVNSGDQAKPASNNPITSERPRTPITQKVQAQFFTFDLERCRISGSTIICDFTITNNDKDRELSLNPWDSGMVDDSGNQYRGSNAQLGNVEGSRSLLVVSGVPVKARIMIDNVSASARRISLLVLWCYSNSGGGFKIEFRNIQLVGALGAVDLKSAPDSDSATVNAGQDPDSANSPTSSALARSGQQTFNIYPNGQWVDTGIDIEPGMRLEVEVKGTISTDGSSPAAATVGTILGGILKGKNVPSPSQPVRRTTGPNAVVAKIRYMKGGESNTVTVGSKNVLTAEPGEYGRVLLAVDSKYNGYTNGSFTVQMKW